MDAIQLPWYSTVHTIDVFFVGVFCVLSTSVSSNAFSSKKNRYAQQDSKSVRRGLYRANTRTQRSNPATNKQHKQLSQQLHLKKLFTFGKPVLFFHSQALRIKNKCIEPAQICTEVAFTTPCPWKITFQPLKVEV